MKRKSRSLSAQQIRRKIKNKKLKDIPRDIENLKIWCEEDLEIIEYFPDNLLSISCSYTNILELPPLPFKLVKLNCSDNVIQNIPILPKTLRELICYRCQLTELPELPTGLVILKCECNYIKYLPAKLPEKLKILECYSNSLTTLPKLPSSLRTLKCSCNNISLIKKFPKKLNIIDCMINNLSYLPDIPRNLILFTFMGNPWATPTKSSFNICLKELCMRHIIMNNINTGIEELEDYKKTFDKCKFCRTPTNNTKMIINSDYGEKFTQKIYWCGCKST